MEALVYEACLFAPAPCRKKFCDPGRRASSHSILAARTRVLRGEFYVRACIVNPRTTEKDVDAAVLEVLASGVRV
jgi:hypothetical protein